MSQGFIYVEADKEAHVRDAIRGLRTVFVSKVRGRRGGAAGRGRRQGAGAGAGGFVAQRQQGGSREATRGQQGGLW